MSKLFLIDGHALIFRSYYAFIRRPLINSKGVDTSVLFGFTKSILEILKKMQPSHIAVAFDPPAKTFRHELFPEYKANRLAAPELIKEALEPLKEIMSAMAIPVIMKEGYEADDIIGTFAKLAEKRGFDVYMVTPDKDFGQLLSDHIYQVKLGSGAKEDELISRQDICQKYDIDSPTQVVDILTLWGDASDNVPGVRGIGEVSSKKLVKQFGSVENIYLNLDKLPAKQREAFEESRSRIDLCKKLVTIDCSADIEFDEESLAIKGGNYSKINKLFSNYEFSSLMRMLPEDFSIEEADIKQTDTSEERDKITYKRVDLNEISNRAKDFGGFAITFDNGKFYISVDEYVAIFPNNIAESAPLRLLLGDRNIIKHGFNLKELLNTLRHQGVEIQGALYDIELMHYILAPESNHKVEDLTSSYLNLDISGKGKMEKASTLFDCLEEGVCDESEAENLRCCYTVALIKLCEALKKELESLDLWKLYESIEMPLIYVLAEMEIDGIKIDDKMLHQYGEELQKEISDIEKNIKILAKDNSLNVSSPKQLGMILFDKLKLKQISSKNGKQSYSTNEETLMELRDKHPIVPLILEFRNIKKLLSTYVEPLPELIDKQDKKIHTTYRQAITATGRLSSMKPNIQNIPIRTERGREIRRAFVPSFENGYILSSDYSQIELRLMAHISGDPDFIQAFRDGQDIHTATAAKIFHVAKEHVSKEQRGKAKTANFGIIYGISSFGLSQRLGISMKEAKSLIDGYFTLFPLVKKYMRDTVEFARKEGYVQTIYGRKRLLPNINSRNTIVRGFAERNAINAPLQGSAADIIKVAMIRIFERMREEKFRSKMVLQVHDELVFDVAPEELEMLKSMVTDIMENIVKLSVPLTVECTAGKNWLEAH